MQSYLEMTKEELLAEKEKLSAEYKKYQKLDLKLDMSRQIVETMVYLMVFTKPKFYLVT